MTFGDISQSKGSVEKCHQMEKRNVKIFFCKICRKFENYSRLSEHSHQLHVNSPMYRDYVQRFGLKAAVIKLRRIDETAEQKQSDDKHSSFLRSRRKSTENNESVPNTTATASKSSQQKGRRSQQSLKAAVVQSKSTLTCSACSKTFLTNASLSHHFNVAHAKPDALGIKKGESSAAETTAASTSQTVPFTVVFSKRTINCQLCGNCYFSMTNLNFHMKKVHSRHTKTSSGNSGSAQRKPDEKETVDVVMPEAVAKPVARQIGKESHTTPNILKIHTKSDNSKDKLDRTNEASRTVNQEDVSTNANQESIQGKEPTYEEYAQNFNLKTAVIKLRRIDKEPNAKQDEEKDSSKIQMGKLHIFTLSFITRYEPYFVEDVDVAVDAKEKEIGSDISLSPDQSKTCSEKIATPKSHRINKKRKLSNWLRIHMKSPPEKKDHSKQNTSLSPKKALTKSPKRYQDYVRRFGLKEAVVALRRVHDTLASKQTANLSNAPADCVEVEADVVDLSIFYFYLFDIINSLNLK